MYNEIYQALCDILFKRGEEGYEYLDETTDIAKILEINLNFDALQIFAVREVEMDKIPNLLLVFANAPTQDPRVAYAEYLMYKGKITKVILINAMAMTGADDVLKYRTLYRVIRECCISVPHYYKPLLNEVPERAVAMSVISIYAPSVIFVKMADMLFDYDSMGEEQKLVHDYMSLMTIYANNNITPDMYAKYPELDPNYAQTIGSIRKAIKQVKISMLLDNSLWMSTVGESYPGTRFLDYLLEDCVGEEEHGDD